MGNVMGNNVVLPRVCGVGGHELVRPALQGRGAEAHGRLLKQYLIKVINYEMASIKSHVGIECG